MFLTFQCTSCKRILQYNFESPGQLQEFLVNKDWEKCGDCIRLETNLKNKRKYVPRKQKRK